MILCSSTVYTIIGLFVYFIYKIFPKISLHLKLNRWKNTPKDILIVHGIQRGRQVPTLSPFIMKLLTYLRMANIKYELDEKDSFGPRGKTPWITINGQHYSDSELIIQHLSKKFEKNLNSNYKDEKLSIGTLVRVMMEEHLFWGVLRFVIRQSADIHLKKMKPHWALPHWTLSILLPLASYKMNNRINSQGMGLHTDEEAHGFIIRDLKVISAILGNKKYLLGDEPCQDDAALFGFIAQFVFEGGLAGDLEEAKCLREEHPNLVQYCYRMKEKFWPDWNDCLLKENS